MSIFVFFLVFDKAGSALADIAATDDVDAIFAFGMRVPLTQSAKIEMRIQLRATKRGRMIRALWHTWNFIRRHHCGIHHQARKTRLAKKRTSILCLNFNILGMRKHIHAVLEGSLSTVSKPILPSK